MEYWVKPYKLLKNQKLRLNAKFAKELNHAVLNWAYFWIRGRSKLKIAQGDALPPGFRLHEVCAFSEEFVLRLKAVMINPNKYCPDSMQFAGTLSENERLNFLDNFETTKTNNFFNRCIRKWKKWTDEFYHLPMSMNILGCSSLIMKWDDKFEKYVK